jgi:hypothetical protein
MPTRPETMMAKLKSAIIATAIWLAVAVPVLGGAYACSEWLKPPTFDLADCKIVLAAYQYANGHHGESCAELEEGGWCVYDSYEGRCISP